MFTPISSREFASVYRFRVVRLQLIAVGVALVLPLILLSRVSAESPTSTNWKAGVATIDITPDYPIRLSGFGFRRTESEGVTIPIFAKALALDDGTNGVAVVITVDNLGVSAAIGQAIANRLKKEVGVSPERLAIAASHTHTAPMLKGVCPTIFGVPIPPEHQQNIERYTREFTDKMCDVAIAAVRDLKPAKLEWGIGKVGIAKNRRTAGGPVDHDLPILVIRNSDGSLRAIYSSYACHCVTLSNNKISGDWAGYAQQAIERMHPKATALIAIGCGADSNPLSGVTGDKTEIAAQQGAELAAEVERLLTTPLTPIAGPLIAKRANVELPFDTLPTREKWQELAKRTDAIGYHATVQLAKLDRGESLQTKLDYPVQTWAFGDRLGMVFLAGEVVVDYSLRLKRELDGLRLWTNAYSNDAPCYIPSERILKEGGYEGGGAMVYYDRPTKLKTGVEQIIVDEVKRQIGESFKAAIDPNKTQASRPLSPQQSLAQMRPKAGWSVELVVAEPFVTDPVAIDFGPDKRLWVAEMHDYPSGKTGQFEPGGRVRVVEDTDGDGRFDRSDIFLDNIPFPTGVTVWDKGVLVCTAPDVLYAVDTDGDRRADQVTKLYSGFGTGNYQARVNSLCYGLDGWVYGSCGLFGGSIERPNSGAPFSLGDRDFRIQPGTGRIEPCTGRTQQGKVRNEWDDWFGCDNSTICRHYPLADHYLRRNPNIAFSDTAVYVPDYPDSNRLYSAKVDAQRFQLSGGANRVTAACGLEIYRDNALGDEFRGNAFVCEPVNLVVHRLPMTPRGCTFSGRRADDEAESEFLATMDNWSRPVQVRTGPDGALWVVDMYRFVIEHPRWIPPADLAKIDTRAGDQLGRIYRVFPNREAIREWQPLAKMNSMELVAAIDSPNGWQRDMAGQLLLWRDAKDAAPQLIELARNAKDPASRLQAMCVLAQLTVLPESVVLDALADQHAGVRRHAIRLAEPWLSKSESIAKRVLGLSGDADPQVLLQLSYSLGEWNDHRAALALAQLILQHHDDPHLLAGALSSLRPELFGPVSEAVLEKVEFLPTSVTSRIIRLMVAYDHRESLERLLKRVADSGLRSPSTISVLANVLDELDSRKKKLADVSSNEVRTALENQLAQVTKVLNDESSPENVKVAAIRLVARDPKNAELLAGLLSPQQSSEIQQAAVSALGKLPEKVSTPILLAGWDGRLPNLKHQVLDVLLSRVPSQTALLERLEKGEIPLGDLDPARRLRLLEHNDAKIRERAHRVFASSSSENDRQKVLESFADVLSLSGDAERGKQGFTKSCSACHKLQDIGKQVGPDLAAIANKSPQSLLQSMLDPSREVDSRYVNYLVTNQDGRTISGLLATESATSITIRGQDGKEEVVLRRDIDTLRSTGKSFMPDGLEKDIPKQMFADILAFVRGTGPKAKEMAGNQPRTINEVNGQYVLAASAAEVFGNEIAFEPPFGNIGMWHGVNDHVRWTVDAKANIKYDIYLDWACDNSAAGNMFVVEGIQPELKVKVDGTGGWDRYRQMRIGTASLVPGNKAITIRPAGPPLRGALMDLRAIYLVAPGKPIALQLAQVSNSAPPNSAPPSTPQDTSPRGLAKDLLNDSIPAATRQEIIDKYPHLAGELVAEMTRDLEVGTKEEYRRIPWIWRVSIAAGKRNDDKQLRDLLEVSLPASGKPLQDWQAVVLGGGIINGISQLGIWPRPRMEQLVGTGVLRDRYTASLIAAAAMVDNEKVPTGTRYDALRMIAMEPWDKSRGQLLKHLAKGSQAELQMGSVSGLVDVDQTEATQALVDATGHLSGTNRDLAIAGLFRNRDRIAALLQAIESKKISIEYLKREQVERLGK